MTTKVLIFTGDHEICKSALKILHRAFPQAVYVDIHDKRPAADLFKDLAQYDYKLVLCFLYPHLIPRDLLDKSALNINFHPGSRDYPGTGCYNFALYEGAKEYGAVCHYMQPKADTGGILIEKRFAVAPDETIGSLQKKTHQVLFEIMEDFCDRYAKGSLPNAGISWTRQPTTRKQLDAMSILDVSSISEQEFLKRVRAFHHPRFPLHIKAGGQLFPLATRVEE